MTCPSLKFQDCSGRCLGSEWNKHGFQHRSSPFLVKEKEVPVHIISIFSYQTSLKSASTCDKKYKAYMMTITLLWQILLQNITRQWAKLTLLTKTAAPQNQYSHFSTLALPPLAGAASNEVPRTVNTLTASSHCTVQIIFPKKRDIKNVKIIRHIVLLKKPQN